MVETQPRSAQVVQLADQRGDQRAKLGGCFDLSRFSHRVHYDEGTGSVRSYLESQHAQSVRIDELDLEVGFRAGERIHTEDSHKYSPEEIDGLAKRSGLELRERFLDSEGRFSLNLFALPLAV